MSSQVQDARSTSSDGAPIESSLVTKWRRSGTEGAGVDLLTCRVALDAFVAERMPARQGKLNPRPMWRDLDHDRVDPTL